MHADTPANSIFDGPITQHSILCIFVEVLSPAHAKRGKALMISNLALLLIALPVAVQQAQQ